MTKILGLDVSSVSTGYCVINNGRLLKSSLGKITFPAKLPLGEKITNFSIELINLIQKHNPDVVIIEDIFRGPNIKTFKTLAMFRGVCFQVVFSMLGKEPLSIKPTEARKLAGVNGVKKEDGFKFVVKKHSLTNFTFQECNDISDAIVLAHAYHSLQKSGLEKTYFISKKRKRKRKKQAK